jgi:curved DNA-binding protein CbpA
MGTTQSIPEAHVRIYKNILNIQDVHKRVQMIQTILSSSEHRASAIKSGIYDHMVAYVKAIDSGHQSKLPGEVTGQKAVRGGETQIIARGGVKDQSEKAMNYFSACLRILELDEEVALTPEILKTAYKKAVIRAHPDKGGSEKEFEAVTRAYAYLGDIVRRILGGRKAEGKVEAPTNLSGTREKEAESWKHVEPVRINPNKMDMNLFNKMFEETRLPDPDEHGYGDWLTSSGNEEGSAGGKFSGKFNRDVFNKAFEEEAGRARGNGGGNSLVVQEMSLASRMGYGVEIGRGARDDFTVAPHEGKMAYTDLKKAYTQYNTFSQETAGVKVENRSVEDMRMERKSAPTALRDYEMEAIQAAEKRMQQAERERVARLAHEAKQQEDYFNRMQKLVIRDGKPVESIQDQETRGRMMIMNGNIGNRR